MEIPPDANPDVDNGALVRFTTIHKALDYDCHSTELYLVINRFAPFRPSRVEIVGMNQEYPKMVPNEVLQFIRVASTNELLTHPHPLAQKMGRAEAEFYETSE